MTPTLDGLRVTSDRRPASTREVKYALLAVASACVSGCSVAGELFDADTPAVVAALDVHNRTLDDLVYVAADGERLDVPPCGSASDSTFRIEAVTVRTAAGYVRGFGAADAALAGQRVHVIEVASAADSGIPTLGPAPEPLPPCAGHPEAQPGI
jgi:hypothetical protein